MKLIPYSIQQAILPYPMNSVTSFRIVIAVFRRWTLRKDAENSILKKLHVHTSGLQPPFGGACSFAGRMSSMGLARFAGQHDVANIEVAERKTCRKQPARSERKCYPNSCINIGYIASYLVSSGLGRYLPVSLRDEL